MPASAPRLLRNRFVAGVCGAACALAGSYARAAPPTSTDADVPDEAAAEAMEAGPEAPVDEELGGDLEAPEAPEAPKPPRIDGGYIGGIGFGGATFTRLGGFDTPDPFVGGGGFLRVGDVVLPWLTIGVEMGGQTGVAGDQRLGGGGLLVEFGFLPAPEKLNLSLRVAYGFGGGFVNQPDTKRSGFGGSAFKAAARWEFFPGVDKRRPQKAGGFGFGPEIGWLGFTPSRKDGPMANTLYLGLSTTYYFGR